MGLSRIEFEVLSALAAAKHAFSSQKEIAEAMSLSLDAVNRAYLEIASWGGVEQFKVTEAGHDALAPYRVENAVIMAAGLSSRCAPLSYERPKGLYVVRGEVLIERQIRQLREAGIEDIVVVVGYKQEQFYYLEEAFGVRLVINGLYAERNNNYTLKLAEGALSNTYICSSDDYFVENPFSAYEYEPYCAAVWAQGDTDEYCLFADADGVITNVSIGGHDAWAMLGHAYFDGDFSRRFLSVLDAVYERPETHGKLWEDVYAEHLDVLRMHLRRYPKGIIYEFDSLEDVRRFDRDFFQNIDSEVFDNICGVLGCQRDDIGEIVPINEGLTNLSCRFSCRGESYVYRHPGAGTEAIIDRGAEAFSEEVAKRLGVDDTFLHLDVEKGWKISRFIDGARPLDYGDAGQVERAMSMARLLHGSGERSPWAFDVFAKAETLSSMIPESSKRAVSDYAQLEARIARLHAFVASDGVEPCLCHNDFYSPNFLVSREGMHLIDWEYSGMADYASDIGTFICHSDYSYAEAKSVVNAYFEGDASEGDMRHCMAYVALTAWHWFVWSIFKEVSGEPVGGDWAYRWYRFARDYSVAALELYDAASSSSESSTHKS